ncbi:MAG TPA: c-type cytochrome, partial [Verrucomicrobiota bacterium]|nr:c-type cytochrome [Verrucomicrobiota bacterium]
YRHTQFPVYFYNGVFLPIWSSGKILFFPELKKEGVIGSSEIFLETTGYNDFAPIDITVAPDGSLFVATGGAKTKSAIYKIQPIVPQKPPPELAENPTPVLRVLNSPQPFEAWSRMNWIPLAERLGFNTFGMVIGSEAYLPEQRARAVEVKMELFGGLNFREARAGSMAISPIVRQKIAWALQFNAVSDMQEIIGQLALDPVPVVRENVLDAASAHVRDFRNIPLLPIITPNIQHPDRQVRIAAANLASRLDDFEWNKYVSLATRGTPISQLGCGISMAMRKRGFNPDLINLSLNIISKAADNQMRLDALRLIIIGMGDYPPLEPVSPISASFEPNVDRVELLSVSNQIFTALNPLFPNADSSINFEIARIFAMLQVDDRRLGGIFTSFINQKSSLASDFYYLSALSVLPPPGAAYTPPPTAKALFTMLDKFNQLPELTIQKSGDNINYLVSGLLKNDPYLNANIVKDPAFIKSGLNHLIPLLDIPKQQQALRLFFESINRRQKIKMTPQLISWIGSFTNDFVWMFLHTQWTNAIFQDEILLSLANNPRPADREIFLQGLASRRSDVVAACLDSLLKIPPDNTSAAQFQVIKLLRRLVREPEQKPLREKALQLLSYMTGAPILIQESSVEPEYLLRIYDPIFIRFSNLYPQVAMRLDGDADAESFRILNLSRLRNFPAGSPERGSQIFIKKGCITCHNVASEFAPSLNNFGQKIPIQFLVQEIIYPDQRLSKDYQVYVLTLKNGKKITGIPRFIGDDYLFVQTTPTNTIRIPTIEVEYMQKNNQSIMPKGLLNGITLQELADLCSFIRQIK